MSYTAGSFSAGEQPTTSKWNTLWNNDAYFDSLIGSGTAWTSWTPVINNFTTGNGSVSGTYVQLGKTVMFTIKIVMGSTSVVGSNPGLNALPVTPTGISANGTQVARGNVMDDSGRTYYQGFIVTNTGGGVPYHILTGVNTGAGSSYSGINSTTPFTWATNDSIELQGTYQAA